ncbi:hypothetical protein OEA41_008876 [Lepraria neglecta]|uniref:Small ribosomal subunit protein uS10m n=1 Tax=Lepraria neglecta TaxID=209136 RepID=A0AAD9Z4T8_9LECA|nr:hypothetical protein OEA41_008876 [Lepraria neglecta]
MASPSIYLRMPLAEIRQSLWRSRVTKSLTSIPERRCQFYKSRETSRKAGFSTTREMWQDDNDSVSKRLSVSPCSTQTWFAHMLLRDRPEMPAPNTMALPSTTRSPTESLSESFGSDLRPVQRGPLKVMDGPTPERDRSKDPRLPRSVQAVYLKPLKRKAKYGYPACDLQLRSYSVRNVEFFADFALRAAYYLNLPAAGPIPLPRITERWTVPRSNFIFKKSQENFERITLRRLIQIQDGHPESVELWLAFLRKHAYYGIGMKANVWQHEKIGVGKTMDISLENLKQSFEPKWAHFGRRKTLETSERAYEMMRDETFEQTVEAPPQ